MIDGPESIQYYGIRIRATAVGVRASVCVCVPVSSCLRLSMSVWYDVCITGAAMMLGSGIDDT